MTAWQKFTDDDIKYVTREKKKCRYKVLETHDIPEESRGTIVSDEVVELSWTRRWERPMTDEELSHRRGRRPKSGVVMVKEKRSGKHQCRRITKWKDKREEGTITFIISFLFPPLGVLSSFSVSDHLQKAFFIHFIFFTGVSHPHK